MSLTHDDIIRKIGERIVADNKLFFVDTVALTADGPLRLIGKKRYVGVTTADGSQLLPPVYDSVDILSERHVLTGFRSLRALYDCREGRPLSAFKYVKAEPVYDYLRLTAEDGTVDLFDSLSNSFLSLSGAYDDFNLRDRSTEYIWARRGRYFDFIHRATGRTLPQACIVMAYDTRQGMFGLSDEGRVGLFTEEGTSRPDLLRRVVRQAGGRLKLSNFTLMIEHYIDVYGNILNL